jgi:putative transposase
MDFVSDITVNGRRFRVFAIVDDFTRQCVALVVDTSFSGARLARILRELGEDVGLPQMIVCDNGPEFTSKALDQWAFASKVQLHFIRPGKPVENAYCESFNGKFRDECLNAQWFIDLNDAREKIDAWRNDYNNVRPHSSLDGRTPAEYERDFNSGLTQRVA